MERLSSYEADRLNDALYGMDKDGVGQTQVSARYVRTDPDGTAWVRLEGADKDTPLTSAMSVRAREGDLIDVSLGGYEAVGGGNRTDPSAGFQDVRAVTVEVEHIKGKQAEFEKLTAQELEADKARIGQLEADSAEIEELVAQKATITQLEAAEGRISDLESDHVSTTDLTAVNGEITNLKAKDVAIEGNITAATGRIGTIEADYLKAADMTAEQARVNNLLAGKATVNDLNAATGRITVLESTKANIADIEANYITADDIDSKYMHADMTNSDVAWIQNGVIANGAISSAMINDVSANKLTAGTINGSVINVTNLNADNITTGTINGQRIGEGSLSLDKLSESVYTEAEVNNIVDGLNDRIDGAIETFTGTAVPTLNSQPASSWNTTKLRDEHVGDVYYVVNSQSQQNGYCYRFTKSGSTYSWQLIKDSDVTAALSRLTTAEGKITTFDSDISTLKTDTGELKTKTQSLETSLGDKVDTTTFNELEDTVDQHSQTISQHTTAISNKADTSTVNQVTNRVSKNEQDISGINTTIGQLQTTVEGKADSSTVTTISNKLNTVETTVNGHSQTISSVQSTLATKADNSTVSTLRTEYNETKTTVAGHETRLTATESVANGVRTDLDNLKIGGRNLLRGSAALGETGSVHGWIPNGAVSVSLDTVDGIECIKVRSTAASAYIASGRTASRVNLEWGQTYIASCWLMFNEDIKNAFGDVSPLHFHAGSVAKTDVFDLNINYHGRGVATYEVEPDASYGNTIPANTWVRFVRKIVTAESAPNADYPYPVFAPFIYGSLRKATTSDEHITWIRGFKVEKGTIPTAWTPAPEDLETEVTTLKTDYATYKQTTTEALAEIGTTYATKTELGTETSNRQTAIQQVNDAISLKANSSDVYTKTQTDGLISTEVTNRNAAITAKADEITSSVSETYATKNEAKQTDSDSGKREIVTEDAAELPLLALTAYGECSQDGTPTPDAPVEIRSVRGRNLFKAKYANMIVNTNGTIAVLTGVNVYVAAVSRNTDYVVSAIGKDRCTVTKVPSENISGGMSGTSLIVANANASTFNSGDADYVAVYLCSTGTEAEPQLEVGSTPTPYVPYGCIGVLSHGKNLNKAVDGSGTNTSTKLTTTVKDSVYTIVGTSESTGGRLDTVYKHSFFIIPAGTYTMSVGASGTGRLSEILHRYSDNTILARIDGVDNGAVTFTLSQSECVFIGINSNDNSTTYNKTVRIQLELGTEATEYEPYRESVSYVDLQGEELCSLPDGTEDVLTVDASGHVTVEKNTATVTLDGTNSKLAFNFGMLDGYLPYFFANDTQWINAGYPQPKHYGQTSANIWCDTMPVRILTAYRHATSPGVQLWSNISASFIFNADTGGTTQASAHTWFSEHPTTIVYPLGEPRTIDLGYIDLPTTFPQGTVHVEAEIQPVIDGSWWTSAGYDAGKAYSEGSTGAGLAALTERVTTAESSITQQAGEIALKANAADTYTKAQTDASLTLKANKATLTSEINASADTVKIDATRVNIEGAAIFTSGRLSQSSLDGAYDESGAADTALTNAKSYVDGKGYQTASDVSQAIATGTSNFATKANAVKRTQRIYWRSASSLSSWSMPTSWLTVGNDGSHQFGQWTAKVPRLTANADGTGAKYPYLYTCEQREMGDGTLAYTTVLLDDSATIIDGGNIITGSVAANKLDVYDATIQKIRADAIDAASITIGQSQVTGLTSTLNGKASTTDVANAAKRTYVSIRATAIDYAADTATLEATLYTDGVATTTGVTYAWLMDGTAISGATSRTYSVPASSGLSHAYSCKATW